MNSWTWHFEKVESEAPQMCLSCQNMLKHDISHVSSQSNCYDTAAVHIKNPKSVFNPIEWTSFRISSLKGILHTHTHTHTHSIANWTGGQTY